MRGLVSSDEPVMSWLSFVSIYKYAIVGPFIVHKSSHHTYYTFAILGFFLMAIIPHFPIFLIEYIRILWYRASETKVRLRYKTDDVLYINQGKIQNR